MVQNVAGEFTSTPSQTVAVGLDFLSTMKIKLLAGRVLKEEDNRYQGILINAHLARKMGYSPEEAVGARVKFANSEVDRKVVGVVENFRYGPARESSQGMVIGYRAGGRSFMLVRVSSDRQQETIASIQQAWDRQGGILPFSYSFVEDQFDELLRKELLLYTLLVIGSLLVAIISCFGLLGIISHTTLIRTKEIGIRKVMGASGLQLYRLILIDYILTYLLALFIGIGIAWKMSEWWLDHYAFQVAFSQENIVIAGFCGLLIVLGTTCFHTIKLIKENPISSLRDE